VFPANHKGFRNLAVPGVVVEQLEAARTQYPVVAIRRCERGLAVAISITLSTQAI
jgi:hypothetical protein